jgi:myo-inositol-1(or 4)-monophosphatase
MSTSAIITVMTGAVRKASKAMLRDFGEIDKLQISKKGVANFVTSADLRTEKTLIEELQRARPRASILSEEAGFIDGSDKDQRFVIDPIDGTTNFIHAIPYVCISLAFEKRNRDGVWETQAGVIYDPLLDELFHAEKGIGAFLNNYRVKVSERGEDVLIAMPAPRKGRDQYSKILHVMTELSERSISIRCTGSAALDLAYTAVGRLDGVWYPSLSWWDMSAGALMVSEAGGMVLASDGSPLREDGGILATNRAFNATILPLVKA